MINVSLQGKTLCLWAKGFGIAIMMAIGSLGIGYRVREPLNSAFSIAFWAITNHRSLVDGG